NRACGAKLGHTELIRIRNRYTPVVISAQRYNGVVSRSRMEEKQQKLAEQQEDERFNQYLQAGNAALVKRFTNMDRLTIAQMKQARLDQELKDAAVRERMVRLEDEQMRKERVLRAHILLNNMKAGPRALQQAMLLGERFYQQTYNDKVNRDIAEEERKQRELEDRMCPMTLIPFGKITEEQIKAEEEQRTRAFRADFMKDLLERRQQKQQEEEEYICECRIERAQYQCLHEKELKAAEQLKQKKREFCRRAYHDAMREKAKRLKYEKMCDSIQDRLNCVSNVAHRKLDRRFNEDVLRMRALKIRERDARAARVGQLMKAKERKEQEQQDGYMAQYELEVEIDEARRQCQKEDLANKRRAYEAEERKQLEEKRQREAQIRRFEVATRFKNAEVNDYFEQSSKRKRDAATAQLAQQLTGQRDDYLKRRQDERMYMSACQADPYLQDDVYFYDEAVRLMNRSREEGRPMFPVAAAAANYRKKNQLDMQPEGRLVRRSRLRDYCWPGYHELADLAYRKYEHRESCREEQEKDRHQVFNNCIKITKMAAEEKPYVECQVECPIRCFHHPHGMPPCEDVGEFDCASVCYDDPPLHKPCPPEMQVL
ncbi:Crtp, partial [Drosophila busckii]